MKLTPVNGGFAVTKEGRPLGSIALRENPYHNCRLYVDLKLDSYDPAFSRALFERLAQLTDRPLQIMTGSENAPLIRFIKEAGFRLARRCFEVEAARSDYTGDFTDALPLYTCRDGDAEYTGCCRRLYGHYRATHAAINPYAADFGAFRARLPETALYDIAGNLAFVEENEIAYVCGADMRSFREFASALVAHMFSNHATICFEADDCDPPAMELLSLFPKPDASYDTYVKEASC